MNSLFKKLSILFILLMVGTTTVACDFFSKTTTTSATDITTGTTTITTEGTTTEYLTSGTWWQQETSIELSGSYKTVYELGEALDTSLLVVKSVNGLGYKTLISSSNYTISGYDANSTGIQVVTVTYNSLTATFVVYVKEAMTIGNFSLAVTAPTKTEYLIGDEFDLTGIEVRLIAEDESYIILSDTQYTLDGYNMMQSGIQTVTISTLGLETSFTITVSGSVTLSAYYQSAEGLSGTALKNQLHTIINTGFQGVTYGDARYILNITDRDPNNSNNVILVYLGTSVSGAWDGGVTWNREHVWPQSLLGVAADNGIVNAASDLQNLKPANPSVNSSRGNKYYADTTTSVSYAPRVEVRGDIARILLYMEVMYTIYNLINSTPAVNQMAMLNILLSWHELDPVDAFEMNRNNVIFTYQKNRNPFIDYPHFVELIWG